MYTTACTPNNGVPVSSFSFLYSSSKTKKGLAQKESKKRVLFLFKRHSHELLFPNDCMEMEINLINAKRSPGWVVKL